jgi:hypothetical protein
MMLVHLFSFLRIAELLVEDESTVLQPKRVLEATCQHTTSTSTTAAEEGAQQITMEDEEEEEEVPVLFRGVCRSSLGQSGQWWWRASLVCGNRQRHLGFFQSPIDAALAYDRAARCVEVVWRKRMEGLESGVREIQDCFAVAVWWLVGDDMLLLITFSEVLELKISLTLISFLCRPSSVTLVTSTANMRR